MSQRITKTDITIFSLQVWQVWKLSRKGKFAYSIIKDHAYLKLCNAFDLVRIHKFGDDDSKKSFNAMCELAMEDDEVKRLTMEEKLLEAETDFTNSD